MEQKEVHIFWDIENCQVPSGLPAYYAVKALKEVALKYGSIANMVAIGKLSAFPSDLKTSLQDSGVIMQDVSSAKPSAADIAILGEIMKLIYYKKPPLVIILITGDRDFSKIVNFLVDRGYYLLLVHPEAVSPVLQISSSSHMPWSEVLAPLMHLKKAPKESPSPTTGETTSLPEASEGNLAPPKQVSGNVKSAPSSPNPKGLPPKEKKLLNAGNKEETPSPASAPTSPNLKQPKEKNQKQGSLQPQALNFDNLVVVDDSASTSTPPVKPSDWHVTFLKTLRQVLLSKKVESVQPSLLASWKDFSYKELGFSKFKLLLEEAQAQKLIQISEDGQVSMLKRGWAVLRSAKKGTKEPKETAKETAKTPSKKNSSSQQPTSTKSKSKPESSNDIEIVVQQSSPLLPQPSKPKKDPQHISDNFVYYFLALQDS